MDLQYFGYAEPNCTIAPSRKPTQYGTLSRNNDIAAHPTSAAHGNTSPIISTKNTYAAISFPDADVAAPIADPAAAEATLASSSEASQPQPQPQPQPQLPAANVGAKAPTESHIHPSSVSATSDAVTRGGTVGARRSKAATACRNAPGIPPPTITVSAGERGSGYMAVGELRVLFPVPPAVLFGLLTHPGKSVAFRSILEVHDRVEVTAPSLGSLTDGFHVFEETQVGETSILWHRSKFRNRLRLEEDAHDPRVMMQRFKLLHGDNLERFEGSWVISATKGPMQEAVYSGGEDGCGGAPAADGLVKIEDTAAAAGGSGGNGGSGGSGGRHFSDEDGWHDVGGLITSCTASTGVPSTEGVDDKGVEELASGGGVVSCSQVETCRQLTGGDDAKRVNPAVVSGTTELGAGEGEELTRERTSEPESEPKGATATALLHSGGANGNSGSEGVVRESDGDGWSLVVLKNGLSPKGVPALVRPAVGRMVRGAMKVSLEGLYQDLADMVKKILEGATVDEAIDAVRDEHRAHRHHGHSHQRKHKVNQNQELLSAAVTATGSAGGGEVYCGDNRQPHLNDALLDLDSPAVVMMVAAAAAQVEPTGITTAMGVPGGVFGTPPLVRNPRTGESVHRWVA